MIKYNFYKSIVDKKFIERYCLIDINQEDDLLMNSPTKLGVEGIISAAYLLCPPMVQVKDYIFINNFWNSDESNADEHLRILEKQFDNNRKDIEMFVNSWSLCDLFMLGGNRTHLDDEGAIEQFGELLVYFWKMRVKDLFPDKDIVVEVGEEIMGEEGLTITMYQRE